MMRLLRRAVPAPNILLSVLVVVTLAVSAILWVSSPAGGDKYSELGVSLFVSALVGLGLLLIERSFARTAEAGERASAEERRFLTSLLQSDDLQGVSMRGRDLSSLVFSGRDLGGADLSLAILDRADLRSASLARATLDGATAIGANFVRSDLREARASGLDASTSTFEAANCSEVIFTDSRFVDCTMAGATLFRATLDRSDFTRADLKRTVFDRVEATGALFEYADLRASSFASAVLTDVCFGSADLRGANFTGATLDAPDLRGTDLRDSILKSTAIRNARTDHQTRWPDGYTPSPLGGL